MKAKLTKKQIADLARKYPEIAVVCEMAEERRKEIRNVPPKKKRKSREEKEIKPTDFLSAKQVAQVLRVLKGSSRRAALNRMLVVLLLETGLRVSEAVNLRLGCLPAFHGKPLILVVDGKGKKTRVVKVSSVLIASLAEYQARHHRNGAIDNFLFRSEGGGGLSDNSAYKKIKRIGIMAGLWVFPKGGKKCTLLSPHKLRHTNASHLMYATKDLLLVKRNLGHVKTDTTNVYVGVICDPNENEMDKLSKQLRSAIKAHSTDSPDPHGLGESVIKTV